MDNFSYNNPCVYQKSTYFPACAEEEKNKEKKKKAVISTPDKPFRNLTMGKFQI